MSKDDTVAETRLAIRFNRRDLAWAAVALPVLATLGASVLIDRAGGGRADAKNQIAPASPSPGTPISCATPIAGSPVANPVMPIVVTMTNDLRFDPPELTIAVGDSITWRNASNMPHTATCDPAQNPVAKSHPDYVALPAEAAPWGSELLQPGESFSYTFTIPGDYHYICIPHVLSGMRGAITVSCGITANHL